MTVSAIMSIDWTQYIQRKKQDGENDEIFVASHPWELNFLMHQVKAIYPQYTDTCVFLSIRAAMKSMAAPLKRIPFTEAVVTDLLRRKPFAEN